MKAIKTFYITIFFLLINFNAYSEQSIEEIIKGRQAILSDNYKTAKRVNALVNDMEFEEAKKFMQEMSENYQTLLKYFPENSKEGFNTEALPIIWEQKDEFDELFKTSSEKMIKLASIIDDADDLTATLNQYMWSSCKACHSKFRKPH